MSDTVITIIATAAGTLVGGVITLAVARLYFLKQDRRAEETFVILARFLESYADVTLRKGQVRVGFSRDDKGRITNASVTLMPEALAVTLGMPNPTVTTGPPPEPET
jgi:hypothetical protein